MPTKRIFDLTILLMLAGHLAFGLPRMAARRWVQEDNGLRGMAGEAILQATS